MAIYWLVSNRHNLDNQSFIIARSASNLEEHFESKAEELREKYAPLEDAIGELEVIDIDTIIGEIGDVEDVRLQV